MVCKKETSVRFSMTEILTNRVAIVRLIFINQTLETTNRWLTGYRSFPALKVRRVRVHLTK